jgi:hypothetical protein
MTCPDRARDLALYVGGDLPDEARGDLEAHLRQCAACRTFLAELETSQAALTELAAEPVPDGVGIAVRARLSSTRLLTPPRRAEWAVAAGLAAAAVVAAFWLAASSVRQPESRPRTTVPPDGSSVGGAGTTAASIAAGPSPSARPQAPTVKPARHAPPAPPASTLATLTTDDADQLARAVVAMSQIDQVSEPPPQPLPGTTPATFVRFATDDLDVVIYWRLDSDGGD